MKTVVIDDEIGYDWWTDSGVTAQTVKEQLAGLGDGEEIAIEINSPGGSVYEGVVIFNIIRDAAKTHPVSVRINCLALSMASYIALAARTVNPRAVVSVSDNSIVLIHNPYTAAWGDYRDMQNRAEYLDKLSRMYGSVHALVSGKTLQDIRAAMDKETYYVGKEILDVGFANTYDAITQPESAVVTRNWDEHIIHASAALQHTKEKAMSALLTDKQRVHEDIQHAVAAAGSLTAIHEDGGSLTAVDTESVKKEGTTMKPEELLAQDKACYDAVFALGEKAALEVERQRVAAHIRRGEKCGAMDIALAHIQGGKPVTDEEVNEAYFTAALDKRREAARLQDNPPPLPDSGGGVTSMDDAAMEAAWDAGIRSIHRGHKGGYV